MVNFAHDFTGDGWPEILMVDQRPIYLYVNPRGESRRWVRYNVAPKASTEIELLKDIDGEGQPGVPFGGDNALEHAKPDPANPTAPWIVHQISEKNGVNAHGMGVGRHQRGRSVRVGSHIDESWYTKDWHRSPRAVRQAVFRPAQPSASDVSLPERTKDSVHPLKFPPIQPKSRCNTRRTNEKGTMLHGVLIDGMIEKIEGNPEFANAEVVRLREEGHAAEYLFGARTEDDFHLKDRTEKQRRLNHRDDTEK